ncbi:had-superfamily hydrolase [Chrysochromulina tobinii]|uniref:Had-superfamily hydrolase n=1 Tax=Chrysochromulina tobinii TaxID=1460289 RepID=A0A0M0JHD8_9EUKA|nr:had-superfamily hydrolase [Chrysochromulina tobinii]|eukprot:KOO25658.1 had-superfamily hydrolase [Chrysochromulina sp. CCMP291]
MALKSRGVTDAAKFGDELGKLMQRAKKIDEEIKRWQARVDQVNKDLDGVRKGIMDEVKAAEAKFAKVEAKLEPVIAEDVTWTRRMEKLIVSSREAIEDLERRRKAVQAAEEVAMAATLASDDAAEAAREARATAESVANTARREEFARVAALDRAELALRVQRAHEAEAKYAARETKKRLKEYKLSRAKMQESYALMLEARANAFGKMDDRSTAEPSARMPVYPYAGRLITRATASSATGRKGSKSPSGRRRPSARNVTLSVTKDGASPPAASESSPEKQKLLDTLAPPPLLNLRKSSNPKKLAATASGAMVEVPVSPPPAFRPDLVAKRRGYSFSWELHASIVGTKPEDWSRNILEALGVPPEELTPKQYVAEYFEDIAALYETIPAWSGCLELLVALQEAGYPMAIATSSPRASFDKKMQFHAPLLTKMSAVVTGDEVLNEKKFSRKKFDRA